MSSWLQRQTSSSSWCRSWKVRACVCSSDLSCVCTSHLSCVCSSDLSCVCSSDLSCVCSSDLSCVCSSDLSCVCSSDLSCVCSSDLSCVCSSDLSCVCSSDLSCVCSSDLSCVCSSDLSCVCSSDLSCVCSSDLSCVCSSDLSCVCSSDLSCVCSSDLSCVCSSDLSCVCSSDLSCVCSSDLSCVCTSHLSCVCSHVVSVCSRHFPKSPRFSLVVQASFDGEQLATDPVEHSEQPPFGTELAWELDRRTLHQHRLQRTPIKLQCFAVDSVSGRKESVGYIVLDLRSVQEVKQEPRWFPLLSSKYTKLKPALLLAAALENDTKFSEPSPDRFKARKAPPRQGSPAVTELLPDRLQAELVQDQGYHQVGPADHCTDMFVLSVTVAFATKLEQLIPSTMKLSAEGSDFFFYYSLLGNDITSEPFHNLLSPDFEPERASVRLRSSSQVLQAFLSRQPSLQIHLCCGNHSLGGTDVSLSALAAVSVDLENRAATVEGAFVLRPPTRVKHTLPALPADLQPTVGVAVTLRREDAAAQSSGNKEGSGARTRSVPTSVPLPLPPAAAPSVPPPAEPRPRSSSPLQKPPDSSPPPPLPPPSFHTESEAESLLEELQRPTAAAADVEVPDAPVEAGASSVSVSAPKVSIPSSAHHYSFSLDLCSLGSLGLTHPVAATLRYSYPFFGSAAPIMTSPPVELQRNVEASVPQSYCAFDFAALPQQLQDTFRSPSEKVAELSYVATLEDLGLVKAREVVVSDSSQNELEAPTQPPPLTAAAPSRSPAPPGPVGPAAPRDTLEYRTALELELWKEEQEDLFDDQEVEFNLLEEQLQKTLADLEKREKQLTEAELQVQRHITLYYIILYYSFILCGVKCVFHSEGVCVFVCVQTQRLQRDLRAEHDLAQRELQESSRRLQLDCDHRAALERDKVRVMEEERARLLQQISDGECRYKQLEREFQSYREQQNVRPEFRLQSEVNLLTLEKVELERKLDSTTKSKLHYKQQWGRALKELARFKQTFPLIRPGPAGRWETETTEREQENAMTRLKKQQAELEVLRRHHLATEEKEAVQQDRRELDDIRNDLNRLKEDRSGPAPVPPGHAPSPGLNDSADEHLSRLLEERDTLLRTGVYTHEDRIIAELTRRIQDAMRNRPIRRDLAPDASTNHVSYDVVRRLKRRSSSTSAETVCREQDVELQLPYWQAVAQIFRHTSDVSTRASEANETFENFASSRYSCREFTATFSAAKGKERIFGLVDSLQRTNSDVRKAVNSQDDFTPKSEKDAQLPVALTTSVHTETPRRPEHTRESS
ncbi:hypothetical protein F2P81_025208 [Scophthalmus maximus]|uniref:C2 domain-containing protein n=1 Tax=Scophthalmus maximus TaxID=52904 RepID=A0A6A4RU75_SCOMX|nr:hypothetical protein F2P81_025208 [Scophthalmus maximus]